MAQISHKYGYKNIQMYILMLLLWIACLMSNCAVLNQNNVEKQKNVNNGYTPIQENLPVNLDDQKLGQSSLVGKQSDNINILVTNQNKNQVEKSVENSGSILPNNLLQSKESQFKSKGLKSQTSIDETNSAGDQHKTENQLFQAVDKFQQNINKASSALQQQQKSGLLGTNKPATLVLSQKQQPILNILNMTQFNIFNRTNLSSELNKLLNSQLETSLNFSDFSQFINSSSSSSVNSSFVVNKTFTITTNTTNNVSFISNVSSSSVSRNNSKNSSYFAQFIEDDNIKKISTFSFDRSIKLRDLPPITIRYTVYLLQYKPKKVPAQQITYRQQIYNDNVNKINANNAQKQRKTNMGLNLFTDVQRTQFDKQFNRLQVPASVKSVAAREQELLSQVNGHPKYPVPPNIIIDWSCKSSEVISQGACGISYISAPVEAISITMQIYNISVSYLSLQEILSCNPSNQDANGCVSGFFTSTYKYVLDFGVGQTPIYFYDDTAKYDGQVSQCNRTILNSKYYSKNKVFIQESRRIRYGDCEQLVKQLRFRAISVAIAASGLQFYMEGTFHTNSTAINHGVTLLGYHPDKGYLIKNTWGKIWGLLGYAYVSNTTGVCSFAYYPVLHEEKGAPILCSSHV